MPALKIAAVLVVIGGAGFGALQLRGSGSGAADTTAAGASDAGAPIVTPVQSSTTDYLRKQLPSQVKSLIATSQEELQSAAANPEGARSSAFSATPSAAAKAAQEDPAAPEPLTSPQGQLLRSPQALQACLKAIGAAQVQPLAVDLARYGGREAAIIVLPADGGEVDVWVVARDCRPGSDGTIDVVNNVKP
jgi:hypothetical protein